MHLLQANTRRVITEVPTVPANIATEATATTGAVVTYTTGLAVLSNTGVSCSPASDATFPLGATTVLCTSTYRAQSTSASFTVTVRDTTRPVITVPANIIAEATSSSGAVVTYAASQADIFAVAASFSCTAGSGSAFPLGATTVVCSATDSNGNSASNSFTVTVRDTTLPVITVPADFTVEATSSSGAVVTYAASQADIFAVAASFTCTPACGSTFPINISGTTVTCSGADTSGNTASKTFKVTVQRCAAFNAFLPPLSTDPAEVHVITTTQTVPLKWSLGGNYGLKILAGPPTVTSIGCVTSTVDEGSVVSPSTDTAAALQYDAVSDHSFI